MNSYLIVFAGAGLDGMLRHGFNVFVPRLLGTSFPYHTLTINILGSLTMGLLAGYYATKGDVSQSLQLFLMTGVLGGFTTFLGLLARSGASLRTRRHHINGRVHFFSVGVSILAIFRKYHHAWYLCATSVK